MGKGVAVNSELEMQAGPHIAFKRMYCGSAKTFKVTKLTPTTTYTFRVRNVGEAGPGPFSSSMVCSTLLAPLPAVAAPTAKVVDGGQAQLTWTALESADQQFELQLRLASGDGATSVLVIAGVQPSKHQLTNQFASVHVGCEQQCRLTGLTPGCRYEARVRLRQGTESGFTLGLFSPPASFEIAPTPVTAVTTAQKQLQPDGRQQTLVARLWRELGQRQIMAALAMLIVSACVALSLGVLA